MATIPPVLLLTVLRHLGLQPLDNYSAASPLFDLQEGQYVSAASDTTLAPDLSVVLHQYLSLTDESPCPPPPPHLLNVLIAYCQLHLSGFRHFTSHEVLHGVFQ